MLRWNADFSLKGKFYISKGWIGLYLQNPSWLNLEHWKRPNSRIVFGFGFGPVTFLFDSVLERKKIHFKLLPFHILFFCDRRIGVDSGVGLKTIASFKWSISIVSCLLKGLLFANAYTETILPCLSKCQVLPFWFHSILLPHLWAFILFENVVGS